MPDRTTRNSSSSVSSTTNPTRNGRLLSRLGHPAGLCAFSLSDISTFGTADNLYARNNVPIPTYSVGRAFRTHLQELADNADPAHYKALLEYVDIDVHLPVLDLPEYGERSTSKKVSRAAIQGSFQAARRDYVNLFRDLIIELERK